MQDVVDNHEEAANAAPMALRLCEMVRSQPHTPPPPPIATCTAHLKSGKDKTKSPLAPKLVHVKMSVTKAEEHLVYLVESA